MQSPMFTTDCLGLLKMASDEHNRQCQKAEYENERQVATSGLERISDELERRGRGIVSRKPDAPHIVDGVSHQQHQDDRQWDGAI